jgi:hypothetical protein
MLKSIFLSFEIPCWATHLSEQGGVRLRATVSEFGPVYFQESNDTQGGVVSIIFKYCDDNKILLDLKVQKVINFITEEGKIITSEYGRISTSTTGIILRKIIEQQDRIMEKCR